MKSLTCRQKYNLVTDMLMGPNVRRNDNLYQGLAILVCALVGGGLGYFWLGSDWGNGFGVGLGVAARLALEAIATGAFLMATAPFSIFGADTTNDN